jgi:hypothetical protein
MFLTKRKKFFIVSIFLAWGFISIQLVPLVYRYWAILGLALIAYPLSVWSLWEDLDSIEWLVNLVLPTLFLPSLALFSFLLPENNLVRIVIFIVAGLGQYGILLSANIFSVAVIRTIQLLRAAQAVGFLFTLVIAFFLFNSLFSFKLYPYALAPLIGLTAFPLVFQSLWTVRLDKTIIKRLAVTSFYISFLISQLSFLISLWPVDILVASLFLVSALYIGLSIIQHQLSERLFAKTVVEYVRLGIIVFIVTFFVARWG